MEIKVREYLQCLEQHTLVKLVWEDYANTEEGYNLWIKSPFANCVLMDKDIAIKHLINYYEWIGDMPIKAIGEYFNWAKLSKKMQREITIVF